MTVLTKECTVCHTVKEATRDNFVAVPRGKYGLSARCRECANAYSRKWASENAQWHLDDQKVRRERIGVWADSLKNMPCADCGQTFPPVAMDWDHLPQYEKEMTVSVMVNRRLTKDRILGEIAKCELICSNCHRVRTAERANGSRYRETMSAWDNNPEFTVYAELLEAFAARKDSLRPVMKFNLAGKTVVVLTEDDFIELAGLDVD